MKNKLETFLRSINSYDQFMRNMNSSWCTLDELISRCHRQDSFDSLISDSFNWTTSKEGEYYWSHVNNLWVKHLVCINHE